MQYNQDRIGFFIYDCSNSRQVYWSEVRIADIKKKKKKEGKSGTETNQGIPLGHGDFRDFPLMDRRSNMQHLLSGFIGHASKYSVNIPSLCIILITKKKLFCPFFMKGRVIGFKVHFTFSNICILFFFSLSLGIVLLFSWVIMRLLMYLRKSFLHSWFEKCYTSDLVIIFFHFLLLLVILILSLFRISSELYFALDKKSQE